jgi:hypothetical protein
MDAYVTFVLDSSGSMAKIEDDTKGGFNIFLKEQREEAGTATVTLYDFNSTVELMYRDRPIEDAPTLDNENYKPGGRQLFTVQSFARLTKQPPRLTDWPPANNPTTSSSLSLLTGKKTRPKRRKT